MKTFPIAIGSFGLMLASGCATTFVQNDAVVVRYSIIPTIILLLISTGSYFAFRRQLNLPASESDSTAGRIALLYLLISLICMFLFSSRLLPQAAVDRNGFSWRGSFSTQSEEVKFDDLFILKLKKRRLGRGRRISYQIVCLYHDGRNKDVMVNALIGCIVRDIINFAEDSGVLIQDFSDPPLQNSDRRITNGSL